MDYNIKHRIKRFIPILVIGGLIIGGLIWNTIKKNQLEKSNKVTHGKVISFKKVGGKISYCRIIYEYNVMNEKYRGSEVVEYFECDSTNIPGCEGSSFKVIYSTKNPENSILDLDQYNQYKHISPSL